MFQVVKVEELRKGDVLFTGAKVLATEDRGDMVWFNTDCLGAIQWVKGTPVVIERRKGV